MLHVEHPSPHRCNVAGHQRERVSIVGDEATVVQDHMQRLQHVGGMGAVVVGVGLVGGLNAPQVPAPATSPRSSQRK